MQAPRPRNTHTAVAIKKALHTPTTHLRPSHSTAAPQTHGVSLGLPRRSPSGRRRAHPFAQTSQTGQTGQTQAPRRRRQHTAVAIKKARATRPERCALFFYRKKAKKNGPISAND